MNKSERDFIQYLIDKASSRDWTNDFWHENGCYYNKCLECNEQFMGYKRRHICRVCDSKYVHLRCHDCKFVRVVPKETGLMDEVRCNVCERSHWRMWWIELPDGSR